MNERLIIVILTVLGAFFIILMTSFFDKAEHKLGTMLIGKVDKNETRMKLKTPKEEIAGYTMGFIAICCLITAFMINNNIITL